MAPDLELPAWLGRVGVFDLETTGVDVGADRIVTAHVGVLDAKGIHAWVDFWGYDVDHDWGWWYKQVEYYLPFLLGKR